MDFYRTFEQFYTNVVRFDHHLGMRLTADKDNGIRYTLEVMEHHLGAPDAAHGGVISGMMDAILGVTALSIAAPRNNLCATAEFKINYISPARLGDLLIATAEVDYVGSKLIVVNGQIALERDGRLIAKAMGTFTQYPAAKKSHFVPQ